MYPFKSLMPSAAGSPVFRDIFITDPDQVMKHITSEISLTYDLLRVLEGCYGSVQSEQRNHKIWGDT